MAGRPLKPASRAAATVPLRRPITQAYPPNIPHPDQSCRHTHRIFLTPTNHASPYRLNYSRAAATVPL
eukprot:3042753-Pyramimonas_sp.AAC.2